MSKKTFLVIVMVAAAVLLGPIADRSMSVFAAATSVTTVEKANFENTEFNDCYGENIHLTLVFILVNHVTFDANGLPHVKIHLNISRFDAVGLTTGINYTGANVVNFNFNGEAFSTGEPPWEFTQRVIVEGQGQGSAPNFALTSTLHVTVNANGETTSQIDRSSFTCRQ